MVWDEKRQCWWLQGECHRPRRREDVIGVGIVLCFLAAGLAALLGWL